VGQGPIFTSRPATPTLIQEQPMLPFTIQTAVPPPGVPISKLTYKGALPAGLKFKDNHTAPRH
jgi:hypothetical protein